MSLRTFLVVSVALACLGVGLALSVIVGLSVERDEVDALRARARAVAVHATTLDDLARQSRSPADLAVLRGFLNASLPADGDLAWALVIDGDGVVRAGAVVPALAGVPDVAGALHAREHLREGLVELDATVLARDRSSGRTSPAGHVVVAAFTQRAHDAALRRIGRFALLALIVAASVAALAAAVLQRRVVAPVAQVVGGLERIAAGALDVEVLAPGRDDEIGRLVHGYNDLVDGLKEREGLRRALQRQVGTQVAHDASFLDAPGRRMSVSVLFVDVRDFTPETAALPAEGVVALLDDVLGRMVAAVHAHGGHVERFLGDGLVAVFGAPVAQRDHAARAVRAALAIDASMATLNAERRSKKLKPLVPGIGVATGEAIAGAVGPPERRVFAVVGEVPALARRIEQEAKAQAFGTLIDDATRALLHDEMRALGDVAEFLKTPPMVVRGVGLPLQLWRLRRRAPSEIATDKIRAHEASAAGPGA